MTEFLETIIHTVCNADVDPTTINEWVEIVAKIFAGVIAIIGLGYLRPLKEKTMSATFSFWSQLSIRLKGILSWLELDCGVLDNMYSPEAKEGWTSLTPSNERLKEFKKEIENTVEYMETTADQMPAYIGWSEDYNSLIQILKEMLVYDICNSEEYFKFESYVNDTERKKYCDNVCNIIKRICKGISDKQKEVETNILK